MTEKQTSKDDTIEELRDQQSSFNKIKPVNTDLDSFKIQTAKNTPNLVSNRKKIEKTAHSSPNVTQSELVNVGVEKMNDIEEYKFGNKYDLSHVSLPSINKTNFSYKRRNHS